MSHTPTKLSRNLERLHISPDALFLIGAMVVLVVMAIFVFASMPAGS